MKYLIGLLFLLNVYSTYSQDYKLPEMNKYKMGRYNWQDTITNNQIEYWDNGNIKVDYVQLSKNKKLRREYFEEGRLKLTIEVKQKHTVDTTYIEDFETGQRIISIHKGYHDIPVGKYFEYTDPEYSQKDSLLTVGQYLKGKKYGVWKTKERALGAIVTANYNAQGKLEGEYIEYYSSDKNKEDIIKWEGQFDIVTVCQKIIDFETGEIIDECYERNVRVGTWKLYDIEGNIISEVTYDWK